MSPRQIVENVERDARVMAAAARHLEWARGEQVRVSSLTFEHEGESYRLDVARGEVIDTEGKLVGFVTRPIDEKREGTDPELRAKLMRTASRVRAWATSQPEVPGAVVFEVLGYAFELTVGTGVVRFQGKPVAFVAGDVIAPTEKPAEIVGMGAPLAEIMPSAVHVRPAEKPARYLWEVRG